ncbi:hypothetical protein EV121DRAFT_273992 [Schizophyllum commune]
MLVEKAPIPELLLDSLIPDLPWCIGLPHNLGELSLLQSFCSQDWLWTIHLDIMFTTLHLELNDPAIVVCPTELTYPALKDQQYVAQLWEDDNDEPIRKLLMAVPVMLSESDAKLTGPNGVDGNHYEPPADLRDIVSWWLAAHGMHSFAKVLVSRGCTRQADWHSCGLLSMNALKHDVTPETYPLIEAAQCDRGRLVMLQRVLRVMNTFAVASIAAELLEHVEDGADGHDSDVDEVEPDTVPHFTRKQLIDVPPPKRDKSKGGRKRNMLLDKLTRKCYYIDSKVEWRDIPAALQDEVQDELVETAPSVQAAALADVQLAKLGDAPPTKAQKTSAASRSARGARSGTRCLTLLSWSSAPAVETAVGNQRPHLYASDARSAGRTDHI